MLKQALIKNKIIFVSSKQGFKIKLFNYITKKKKINSGKKREKKAPNIFIEINFIVTKPEGPNCSSHP